MAVLSDGIGIYVITDEEVDSRVIQTRYEIDGEKLYEFDPKTGVLQISMSPEDVEFLLEEIDEIPEEGKTLTLPTPLSPDISPYLPEVKFKNFSSREYDGPIADGPARFQGVKKIESIPNLKEEDYLMELPEFFKLLVELF